MSEEIPLTIDSTQVNNMPQETSTRPMLLTPPDTLEREMNYEKKIKELQCQIINLENDIGEVTDDYSSEMVKTGKLEVEIVRLSEVIKILKAQIDVEMKENKELKEEIAEYDEALTDRNESYSMMERENDELKKDNKNLKIMYKTLKKKYDELYDTYSELYDGEEEKYNMMKKIREDTSISCLIVDEREKTVTVEFTDDPGKESMDNVKEYLSLTKWSSYLLKTKNIKDSD